jgi:hypothetical protein
MTTKAFPDQDLVRKPACPGSFFVPPGKALHLIVNRHVECNSIADATAIKLGQGNDIKFSKGLQTVSMIGIAGKIPGDPHA